MMDEFYNVNDAKEALCYFSLDFDKDMKYAREESRTGCRRFDREFVLPDYVQSFKGSVRLPLRLQMMMEEEEAERGLESEMDVDVPLDMDGKNENDVNHSETQGTSTLTNNHEKGTNHSDDDDNDSNNNGDGDDDNDSDNETEEQTRQRIMKQREEEKRRREMEEEEHQALLLSVERFAIPEILLRPSDIDMKQLGLAEAIVQSIQACDPIYHAAMYHNIILTGGNLNIPNFKERLEIELRSIAPIEYKIRIVVPNDPISFAFEGAQDVVRNDNFMCGIDRAEWETLPISGKGNIWNSKQDDGNLPNGMIII